MRMYFHNDYFSILKMVAGTLSETSSYSTPNRQQNVIFDFTLLTFTNMFYREINKDFKFRRFADRASQYIYLSI